MANEQRRPLISHRLNDQDSEPSVPLADLTSGLRYPGPASCLPSTSPGPPYFHEAKFAQDSIHDVCTPRTDSHEALQRVHGPGRHTLFNWWLEILACVTAITALLALFATLYFYADKPSPEWPDWISLNTVVAILVVLLKTSILLVIAEGLSQLKWTWFTKDRPLKTMVTFDDASRGPYGAFVLLYSMKFRYILASLGASIVVAALATDPFAQQIIRYYNCTRNMYATPAIRPRSNFYDQTGPTIPYFGSGYETIDDDVRKALNAGIFAPSGPLETSCLTGNCTWPSEYSSVAMCSSCEDVSHELRFDNKTWTRHEVGYSGNRTYTTWNLTTSLPSGLTCTSGPDGSDSILAGFGSHQAPDPEFGPFHQLTFYEFILGKSVDGPVDLSSFAVHQRPYPQCVNASATVMETWPCRGYGAARCQILPCVKTYKAVVSGGILNEQVTNTFSKLDPRGADIYPRGLGALDTKCIDSSERTALVQEGYRLDPNQRWLTYNLTFKPNNVRNNSFPQSMAARGCLYGFASAFTYGVDVYFPYFLTGSITNYVLGPAGASNARSYGPLQLLEIYNLGNIDFGRLSSSFANITDSITNLMRQTTVPGSGGPAVGNTIEEKTCVAVKWAWITFPASLVLLTLIFFVLMIIETRPVGLESDIWKSSPLGLLYYSLARSEGQPLDLRSVKGLHGREAMEACAENVTVRLSRTKTGRAILEVTSSTG